MFNTKSGRRITYWLKRVFFWLGKDRPRRMRTRGRPPDPEFHSAESLYLRCLQRYVRNGKLTDVGAIRFPDQSVNRAKYSKPCDLLVPLPKEADGYQRSRDWRYQGVAGFPVRCVPPRVTTDAGVELCRISVEHDPIDCNYAHSEIRAYVGDQRLSQGQKEVSKVYRKRFRLAILREVDVTIEPLI